MAITFGSALGSGTVAGGGTSVGFNTTAVVPSGARIIVGVTWFHASATASLSGGSLSWTQDHTHNTGSLRVALFSAPAPSGLASGTTLTATFSIASDAMSIGGAYWEGIATSGYEDASNGSSGTTNAWATGTVATTAADCALVGFAWRDLVTTTSTPAGTDTEVLDFQNTFDTNTISMVYRILSGTATEDVGGTWAAGSASWVAVIVAYSPAVAVVVGNRMRRWQY